VSLKIVAELPANRRFAGALRLDVDGRTVAGPYPVRGGADGPSRPTPLGTYRVLGLLPAGGGEEARLHGRVRIEIAPAAEVPAAGDAPPRAWHIQGAALAADGSYPPTDGGLRLSDEDLESLLEAIGDAGAALELCEIVATPVELIALAAPGASDEGTARGGPPGESERQAAADPKRQFLLELGTADVAHSRDGLLDHLEGTRALLAAWGAREALCDAGLFHSVYGTESFQHPSLSPALRERVRELIGAEAEEIVYLNHVKESDHFVRSAVAWSGSGEAPPLRSRFSGAAIACGGQTLRDLIDLSLANALEQAARVPQHYGPAQQRFLRSLLAAALPGARAEIERLFGKAE
jgi:hypothetical protein